VRAAAARSSSSSIIEAAWIKSSAWATKWLPRTAEAAAGDAAKRPGRTLPARVAVEAIVVVAAAAVAAVATVVVAAPTAATAAAAAEMERRQLQ